MSLLSCVLVHCDGTGCFFHAFDFIGKDHPQAIAPTFVNGLLQSSEPSIQILSFLHVPWKSAFLLLPLLVLPASFCFLGFDSRDKRENPSFHHSGLAIKSGAQPSFQPSVCEEVRVVKRVHLLSGEVRGVEKCRRLRMNGKMRK